MAETIGQAYIQIIPSTDGIKGNLEKSLSGEAASAGTKAGNSAGTNFLKGFGSVAAATGKAIAAGVVAGTTAVAGLTKSAVEAYSSYEQLEGGVETLFGAQGMSIEEYAKSVGSTTDEVKAKYDSLNAAQSTVMSNASNAYKTAGMSANEYMESVTSFAAALNSSLGGDTEKSAQAANTAITDMADNANKMGTSMESIQNAYMGFSKQNYTMLDNLKLGYGGTKSEMERLLADATKLSGVKYDISSLNDVYSAIHVVQTEMGITGTTAKEASTTIEGSANMMKASWENLITGMGSGDSITPLVDNLLTSFNTFLTNLTPVVTNALTNIGTAITAAAPQLTATLSNLVTTVLPTLMTIGGQLISTIGSALLTALPQMLPQIMTMVAQFGTMILQAMPQLIASALSMVQMFGDYLVQNLPMIITAAVQLITTLATGIAQALPTLIPTIITIVLTIVESLLDNIDMLIDAAIQLVTGLAEGIVNGLPVLIEKAPTIILKLANALANNAPKLITAAIKIMLILGQGMITSLPKLLAKVPEIIAGLIKAFQTYSEKIKTIGKNIVEGIWNGIKNAWDKLVQNVSSLATTLVNKIKDFFKIGSPSKLMADAVGQYIPSGIAVGITANASSALNAMDTLGKDMTSTIQGRLSTDTMSAAYRSGTSSDSSMYSLMEQYLPYLAKLANGSVNISLEGDADKLFQVMQKKNGQYKKMHGASAFA